MPDRWLMMAWHANFVFTMRSMELWAEPAHAAPRLMKHAAEKQRAMLKGMVGVTQAMVQGVTPLAVVEAAFEPARRRVAANARGLAKRRSA
jgi:hypothetical protein